MKRPAFQKKQVVVLRMAFRARKGLGTFEKRVPGVKLRQCVMGGVRGWHRCVSTLFLSFFGRNVLGCTIPAQSLFAKPKCEKTRRDWVGERLEHARFSQSSIFCRSTNTKGATVLANCFRTFTDILLILEYGFNS